MATREEIREGIELLVAKKFSKLMPDRFPNDWLSLNGEGLTRQILEHLHSQGVVIKVEGPVTYSFTTNYKDEGNARWLALPSYIVAAEPLIEER